MPAVILRPTWNAAPPLRYQPALHNVAYVPAHHIGGGPAYPSDTLATVKAIQAMEQRTGYVDIAYCWGADYWGNEIELRGDVRDGATLGYAGISFSVLLICNAEAPGFVPSAAMEAAFARIVQRAMQRGIVAPNALIDGHHNFDAFVTKSPTDCPGGNATSPLGAMQSRVPVLRKLVFNTPPAPTPVPAPKVKPMADPAFSIPNVRGWCDGVDGKGQYIVTDDGALYCLGTKVVRGMNGDPNFAGRHAASCHLRLEHEPPGTVTIVATSGEHYTK